MHSAGLKSKAICSEHTLNPNFSFHGILELEAVQHPKKRILKANGNLRNKIKDCLLNR